jgi:hypothetical protein
MHAAADQRQAVPTAALRRPPAPPWVSQGRPAGQQATQGTQKGY